MDPTTVVWLIGNFKLLFDKPEPALRPTIHFMLNIPVSQDQSGIETMTAMPPLEQNQCEAVAQQSDQDHNQVGSEFPELLDVAQAIALERYRFSPCIPGFTLMRGNLINSLLG